MCAVQGKFLWEADRNALQIMLAGWCLFNIFEFGRKTYCTAEERPEIESYSKIFGRFGAVILVVAMGAISAYLLGTVELIQGILTQDGGTARTATYAVLFGGPLMTAIVGSAYALSDHNALGAAYRAISSIVIVFVYGGLFGVLLSLRGV
jgi:4-hydroxybenzoate polyprenyltransferase